MSKYYGFAIAIIGTNGTGKSTWMDDVIKKVERDVLILSDDDSEIMWDKYTEIENPSDIGRFRGKAIHYVEDIQHSFAEIYQNFGVTRKDERTFHRGGLIAIDDAMAVLSTRDTCVMKLFKKRRQRKLDILLNCHGASEFPISLFKNMTGFLICKTTDSTKALEQRMNGNLAKVFVECINYVNEKAKQNPYFKIYFDMSIQPESLNEVLMNNNL